MRTKWRSVNYFTCTMRFGSILLLLTIICIAFAKEKGQKATRSKTLPIYLVIRHLDIEVTAEEEKVRDAAGYAAIAEIHKEIDDDNSGSIDHNETAGVCLVYLFGYPFTFTLFSFFFTLQHLIQSSFNGLIIWPCFSLSKTIWKWEARIVREELMPFTKMIIPSL